MRNNCFLTFRPDPDRHRRQGEAEEDQPSGGREIHVRSRGHHQLRPGVKLIKRFSSSSVEPRQGHSAHLNSLQLKQDRTLAEGL
jgi:hypothetical protein